MYFIAAYARFQCAKARFFLNLSSSQVLSSMNTGVDCSSLKISWYSPSKQTPATVPRATLRDFVAVSTN